ncbi:MAG: tetratricopeptide repeat protein [Gemmatimonadota bacterium]|nr:tetratricopeptide repeat protein [Gemmatimonadota bacterium]
MTNPADLSCLAGFAAAEAGDHTAAMALYTEAVAHDPERVDLRLVLANAQRLAGEVLAARRTLRGGVAAAQRAPIEQAYALAGLLVELGEGATAVPLFTRVATQRPKDAGALAALATALRDAGQLPAAMTRAQRAMALAPSNPAVLFARGQVYHARGDTTAAIADYDRALRHRPAHAPTLLQRGYSRLLAGDHAGGWTDYEARGLPVSSTGARDWHGEPLEGGSLLLLAEQGIGDQLQFLRFAALAQARGAGRVMVEAHASLVGLLRANAIDAVPRGSPPPSDWSAPLLSLPHRLGLGADVMTGAVPYLRATPGPAPLLPVPKGRPRLGLVWSGNPEFPRNAERSLDADTVRALVHTDTVDWIALQQGPAALDLEGVVPSVGTLTDWETTARVLAALDGLVTTCTGIAHLAGAMGVPVFVLLPVVPDWRWGLRTERSPWYPSARLVRQRQPGDWQSVTQALHAAVATTASR